MENFKEDVGYPSDANSVAEPSDLGQVKGAKKQKRGNGVARVKNKIDTKPTLETPKQVNESMYDYLNGYNSSPFHKEKAIRCKGVVKDSEGELKVIKQIAKASDYPELKGHIHHAHIAKAAKMNPVGEEDEGFIGHDDKFYSTAKLHSKVHAYVAKHGYPDLSEKINFSRKDPHSILRFHEYINENKFIEKKDSHAVIGFGRFNPPHAGHQVLVDKIRSHAALVGGKPHVFVSHSEGNKKNPLPYHKKIKLMKKAFGDVVHETEAKNPYDVAKELNGKFDHLTLVAGEDRIKGYKDMLKSGEGKDFNYKSVHFKSVPRNELSATKMRQWALQGNHKDFEASLPDELKGKSHKIMKQVKKGLLKEDLQEDFKTALNSFSYRSGRKGGDYDAESGPYHKEKAVEFENNKVYKASEFPRNEVSDKGFVHHAAIARAARDKDSNLSTSHEAGFITHGGKFIRYDKFDSLVHQHMLNNGPPTNGQKIDISNGVSKPQSDLAKFHNQKEEISESALISILKKYLSKENSIREKDLKALQEKSEKSGIELDTLKEIYELAVEEWCARQEQTFLTTEQWAFNRVNSYIHENIKVHKLECEPCNKHYESRWPKQQCPTCHTKLKVTGTYEQGSSHPVIKEESFNHHSSACTKCNKIYNNFSCAFKCKHPLIRIGLCDKCKNLKEDHGAGFVGTDKLVKKYAKVTPGQEKIKAMYNKYIEDKFVKESVSSDPYQGGDLFNDLDKPSSPFHREKALKNFKTGKIHKESEFDPEKIKGENDIITYHSMMAQEAAKKDKISNFRRQDYGRHYERGYIGHHGKYMADNEMEKFSNNHVLTNGYPEPHEKIRPDRHYSALSKFHEEQLPQVKGRQMYKAFLRDGWEHKRTVGSHRVMSKAGRGNFILCHGDNEEIHSPMVHKIVKQSGLNPARLREAHEPDAEKEARRTRILKRYAAKCKGLKEDHGAGFQGTSKLTKKYAKDTPGQSKLKIMYNKYVEDKFVKEEAKQDDKEYFVADKLDDIVSPFHKEKAIKFRHNGKIHRQSDFPDEHVKDVNSGENGIAYHYKIASAAIGKKGAYVPTEKMPSYERGFIGHNNKYYSEQEMTHFANNHVLTNGYPEPHERLRPDRHYSSLMKFHEDVLVEVVVTHKRDYGSQMGNGGILHDFEIHHNGEKIGRIYTMHYPKEKKLDIGYFEVDKEHQGHHGLAGAIKGLRKHFPDVKTITGDRVTGRHKGINSYKVPAMQEAHEPNPEKEARRNRILKKYGAKGTGTSRRRQMDSMKAFEGWTDCEHKCPEHGVWSHEIPLDTKCHNPAFHPCEKCLAFEPEAGSEFAHLKIDLTSRKKK